MPTHFTKRLSISIEGLHGVTRKEKRAFVRDVGRFVRDRARAGAPKRSGATRTSVKVSDVREAGSSVFVDVGSNLLRARWLEEGTGLYGPKRKRIYPTRAKALAWRSTGASTFGVKGGRIGPGFANTKLIASGVARRSGRMIRSPKRDMYMTFARSVRGIRPFRFLEKAFRGPETASYWRQRRAELAERIKAARRGG